MYFHRKESESYIHQKVTTTSLRHNMDGMKVVDSKEGFRQTIEIDLDFSQIDILPALCQPSNGKATSNG